MYELRSSWSIYSPTFSLFSFIVSFALLLTLQYRYYDSDVIHSVPSVLHKFFSDLCQFMFFKVGYKIIYI